MNFCKQNFNFVEVQFVDYSFWWILIFMSSLWALCLGLHIRFCRLFSPKRFTVLSYISLHGPFGGSFYMICVFGWGPLFLPVMSGCYSIICWKALLSPGNWICQKSVKHISWVYSGFSYLCHESRWRSLGQCHTVWVTAVTADLKVV